MRIGDYELRNIRNKVLDDLYRKSETELEKRKTAIAKKNRELYLEPMQHLLDQLPKEMVSHAENYCLKIKYTPTDNKNEIVIDEKWEYKEKDPIINPKISSKGSSYYYSNVPECQLDPRLQTSAAELCEDILTLRVEKEKMSNYLVDTTTKYTGSLQLRKVWPETLHKYLPAEPVKVKKPKLASNKISVPDPTVPTALKTRLTTNLLEGE